MYKRSIILIDGSNFYFKLNDIGLQNQLKFDFRSFSKYLSKTYYNLSTTYYIGAVKTDGTKRTLKLHTNQQKLLRHLRENNVEYVLGYLLKSHDKFHEKGVDVRMAVDILVYAYEDLADHFVLVSSDTDLIPSIKQVQKLHKTVEYVGFEHMVSKAMKSNCNMSKLLTKEELEKFVI